MGQTAEQEDPHGSSSRPLCCEVSIKYIDGSPFRSLSVAASRVELAYPHLVELPKLGRFRIGYLFLKGDMTMEGRFFIDTLYSSPYIKHKHIV